MDQILLVFFILFCFLFSNITAQQSYSGNSVLDCDNTDETGPSPAFLYTCNGKNQSCGAFLIFKSQPPYDTVSTISKLTSSDPSELGRINDISTFTEVLPTDKEVIVPVNCSCSGQYYQANTSFIIPTIYDTYFTIANNTYQGLSTCNILMRENNYSATKLHPGLILQVPLRCACPTNNQTVNGTKFLFTYLVSWGDNVPDISKRFNVSKESIVYANGFTEDDPPIYPFTTILIPLPTEPLSSQTIIHHSPPSNSPPFVPNDNHNKKRSRKGIYLWTGIGISLLVLCFVLSIVLFHFKKKKDKASQIHGGGKKKQDLPEGFLVDIATVDQGLKFFRHEELNKATENFSTENKINGSVYRGVLEGKTVAIKQMNKNVSKEVNLLKKINHFNLISLCGACEHQGSFYLVYEFMENGSLRDWLQNKRYPEFESWYYRFQIALDVAYGLHYLHNCTHPGYVHKDISSSNVLLDKDLRAKIANFSLARSAVREESGYSSVRSSFGTKGYMAPEYMEYGLVTYEMDTYAFGVIVLELLSGKEAVYLQNGKEVLLAEAASSIMEGRNAEANLRCLIDPNLQAENKMQHAQRMIKLSLACTAEEP
ncbi:protein LYK5-like [Pistacia vera]|uniref:protein LYK5-like n=1 Tax=Pistacia vera TaxID=55513 RepID=UPI001263D9CE|nr:protein LYK5-like [Pistacia vera]